MERLQILRSLREGSIDVIVGVNLLREGLNLPEVSLVVILDADKEGFLRSDTALIQVKFCTNTADEKWSNAGLCLNFLSSSSSGWHDQTIGRDRKSTRLNYSH